MLWLGRVYNSMVTKELQELQKYDILSQTDLQNIWKKQAKNTYKVLQENAKSELLNTCITGIKMVREDRMWVGGKN